MSVFQGKPPRRITRKEGNEENIRRGRLWQHQQRETWRNGRNFMNFASTTSERDAVFTELTTTNGNTTTQLSQKEDHIQELKVETYKLKVEVSAQKT